MKQKFKTLFILLCFFAVSVAVRAPEISSSRYTANMWHVWMLTTLENWSDRGMADCHYAPIQTWNNPGDKFIDIYPRLVSAQGDNYYVSYPPFAFYFGYAALKIFHLPMNGASLYWINLLLHFITAFFVYYFIQLLTKRKWYELNLASLSGFLIYVFTPCSMLLHGQVFFPEMLSTVILVPLTILFYRIITKEKFATTKIYFLFSILLFFLCYTEWIGVFTAFSFSLVCWLKRKSKPELLKLLPWIIIPFVLAISLTVIQYSSIAGFEKYANALWQRFSSRTGYFGTHYSDEGVGIFNLSSYGSLITNLIYSFGLLLLLPEILFAKNIIKNKFRSIKRNKFLLFILFAPAAFHFLAFTNLSFIHSHALAKWVFPLSVCTGLILQSNFEKVKTVRSFYLLFGVVAINSLLPVIFSIKIDSLIPSKDLQYSDDSIRMQSEISPDDAVFIRERFSDFAFYCGYYLKRNIAVVKSKGEAFTKMRIGNKKNAILFYSSHHFVRLKISSGKELTLP